MVVIGDLGVGGPGRCGSKDEKLQLGAKISRFAIHVTMTTVSNIHYIFES